MLIKNNKFLVIILFLLLFLFVSNDCKAASDLSFTYNNIDYSTTFENDLFNYMIVSSGNKIVLFNTSNTGFYLEFSSSGSVHFWSCKDEGNGYGDRRIVATYVYDFTNNVFSFDGSNTYCALVSSLEGFEVLDANCDVYINQDDTGVLGVGYVFEKDFLTPPAVEKTLMGIFKIIPLAEVQQEIIQILPLIIVVVVSLIGLRKALRLLLTLLHKA